MARPLRPSAFERFVRSFDEHPLGPNPDVQLAWALEKELKGYHSQLIALGSAIGTGLFIASGEGLALAGPVPLLAAFCFLGMTLCPTVFALGEMATLFPQPGGFFEHCRMFTDEAWGGAMGWNYVLGWLLTLPLELVASSITLQYWGNPLGNHAAWVTIFLVCIVVINILGVKRFADFEAGLSVMKVVAIIGFIIFGILRDAGLGFHGQAIGTLHWYEPGAVRNGWYGFCSVLIIAAYAYSGSEMVGLTAAEQEDPKRDMPRAIKKVFWRIGLFYIASIFLVGLLVPFNDPHLLNPQQSYDSKASPFVIALRESGVRGLPSVLNSVILITVLSVANSSVYGSSRVLGAMADAGLAPQAFAYIDTKGRPLRCFYLSFAFGCLAYLADLHKENTVFIWLVSLGGLSSIISWTSICATHIRFRQALRLYGKTLESLPYRSPLGVIGSWIGLLCNIFIIVIQFITAVHPVGYSAMSSNQRAVSFFQSFMAFPLVAIIYLGFKFFKGTEIQGVTFSWRSIRFDNPSIIWGEGTTVANLRREAGQVNFDDSWNRGDYLEWARDHPELQIWEEELWWCPKPLRPCIRFFYFPWDRRRNTQTDAEMAFGDTIDSRDGLIEAVHNDAGPVFRYIQRLWADKEAALRTQFGAAIAAPNYIIRQEELIARVDESPDSVFSYMQRLRAQRKALLRIEFVDYELIPP